MRPDLRPLLLALAAAAVPLAHAGSVEVRYDARASFTDAGTHTTRTRASPGRAGRPPARRWENAGWPRAAG